MGIRGVVVPAACRRRTTASSALRWRHRSAGLPPPARARRAADRCRSTMWCLRPREPAAGQAPARSPPDGDHGRSRAGNANRMVMASARMTFRISRAPTRLRVEEVNAGARQQRGHGVAHADDRAERGQGQQPVLGVDMRGVDGLGHALQQVPLTVDDALRPAGASGREQHACGFVHAELGGPPTFARGSWRTGQMEHAHGADLDAGKDTRLADDQAGRASSSTWVSQSAG